jgi:acetoin utilization deacetylase AcuC-like enzyme
MAKTGFVWDERYLAHDTGPGHPERSDRLLAIRQEFDRRKLLERLTLIPAEPIDIDNPALLDVHDAAYLRRLRETCASGAAIIDDGDCAICPATYEIARLSAGGVLKAVEAVADGRVDNAFCAVRPPGHHAERHRAMGFCFINNVAVAARHAQRQCGLRRVLIVDWDVHHGNGTQHAFEEDPSVLYCSLHEDPRVFYPGTGFAHEHGRGDGEGATLNLPMKPGAGDSAYHAAFERKLLPTARVFRPDLLLVSAGFDAHADDPLAHILLTDDCLNWMTRQVLDLAAECCDGRLVSVLEGGYDLAALSRCAANHVEQLLG